MDDEERLRLEEEAVREAELLAVRRREEIARRRNAGVEEDDGFVIEYPDDMPETKDIGQLAAHIEDEIFDTLYGLMKNPKAPPAVRKSCCDALLDRAKGKASAGSVVVTDKPGRELNAGNLERLLVAQISDDHCAAWFGFGDVEEFLQVVEADEGLNKVYQIGRKVGQVEFLVNQWGMGQVDRNLNVWVGKQNLGQTEKVEQVVKIERIEVSAADAASAYQRLLGGGLPVIEAEIVPEVEADMPFDPVPVVEVDAEDVAEDV